MTRLRVPTPAAPPQQINTQRQGPIKATTKSKNTPAHHKGSSTHFTRRRLSHASSALKEDRKSLGQSPFEKTEFDPNEDTFYDADPVSASDHKDEIQNDEDVLFYWEEENTLLSELLDSPIEESKEQDLDALAESLQPCFDERGRELKKEIAETLVPTVNRVKALYKRIDTEVDEEYARGLLTFNKACKDLEGLAIRDQDEFRHTWLTTQTKIEDLISQLEEAYKARERLWADFESAFDNIANPLLDHLRETPANVERVIATLDRHAKTLEKDESTSTAEKNLMEMLRKNV